MPSPTQPSFVPVMLGSTARLAARSPLELLLYLALLGGLSWAVSVQVGKLLVSTVHAADVNIDFTLGTMARLTAIARLAGWLVAVPLVVVAAGLPVRLVNRSAPIGIGILVQLSPQGYLQAFRTIYVTLRVLIYQLIPIGALYFIYAILGLQGITTSFQTAATIIAILIAIPLILRLIPTLHAPLASIVLDFAPAQAIQFSREALLPFVPNLFLCFLACSATATLILVAHQSYFESSMIFTGLVIGLSSWYYLTTAAICIAEAFRSKRASRPGTT